MYILFSLSFLFMDSKPASMQAIIIKQYKGEKALEQGINDMFAKGYRAARTTLTKESKRPKSWGCVGILPWLFFGNITQLWSKNEYMVEFNFDASLTPSL